MDNTITITKNAIASAVIYPDRFVVGTEDGLFCVDLDQLGEYYFIKGYSSNMLSTTHLTV